MEARTKTCVFFSSENRWLVLVEKHQRLLPQSKSAAVWVFAVEATSKKRSKSRNVSGIGGLLSSIWVENRRHWLQIGSTHLPLPVRPWSRS